MDVLEYSGRRHCERALHEPGILRQSTVWWVIGQLHRHGPSLLWKAWLLEKGKQHSDSLAAKHFLEQSLSIHKVQWNEVLTKTTEHLSDAAISKHGRCTATTRSMISGPNPTDARNQREEVMRAGEPNSVAIMADLSFGQKLSCDVGCDVVGEKPWEKTRS